MNNKTLAIDLSKTTRFTESPSPRFADYQKIWTESPRTNFEFDTCSDCVFCREPVSPRKIVMVINKIYLIPRLVEGSDPPQYVSNPNPKFMESCCLGCAQSIKSYPIPSPRQGIVPPKSSPTTTPRRSRSGSNVLRRRSLSSISDSNESENDGSPRRPLRTTSLSHSARVTENGLFEEKE